MSNRLVSVVAIGRNEGERLVRCLQSIAGMRREGFEVETVYVDSASTDGSPERARNLGARVLEVRPERPCAAVGRNAGGARRGGVSSSFSTGTRSCTPTLVARSLPEVAGRVAVVWGHRRESDPGGSVYNRILDLDWIYPPGPSEFCGGDALMRRDVLEEVGGYDEGLIAGEEPEMCRRMRAKGWTIHHADRPMTLHDLAMKSLRAWWRRALRAGHAYAEVSDRFRGTGMPLWEEDARRNVVRGGALLALFAAGLLGSLALLAIRPVLSPLPLVVVAGLVVLLAARTGWKARWKGGGAVTLFLYGLHSQLQQIPILAGQLAQRRDARAGRRRGLIEYKGASS
jgi:GT2 family glycosyltransferase